MRMRMLTLQRRVNSGKRPPVCHVQQTFNEPGMADATVFKLQDGSTSSLSLKSVFLRGTVLFRVGRNLL